MKKENFYSEMNWAIALLVAGSGKEVIIGETESVFVKPLLCFENFQEEER